MGKTVAPRPLAEIMEEGKKRAAAVHDALVTNPSVNALGVLQHMNHFYIAYGPRLLAVAAAAVEMRPAMRFYFGRHSIESDADHGSTKLADAAAAFDLAASGEEKR